MALSCDKSVFSYYPHKCLVIIYLHFFLFLLFSFVWVIGDTSNNVSEVIAHVFFLCKSTNEIRKT